MSIRNGSSYNVTYPVLETIRMELLHNGSKGFLNSHYYYLLLQCQVIFFKHGIMAIQKGNAQCVTGCVKDPSSGLEGLFNFHVQEAEEL